MSLKRLTHHSQAPLRFFICRSTEPAGALLTRTRVHTITRGCSLTGSLLRMRRTQVVDILDSRAHVLPTRYLKCLTRAILSRLESVCACIGKPVTLLGQGCPLWAEITFRLSLLHAESMLGYEQHSPQLQPYYPKPLNHREILQAVMHMRCFDLSDTCVAYRSIPEIAQLITFETDKVNGSSCQASALFLMIMPVFPFPVRLED
mmetsp:Transcript_16560/g.56442  ORF Transcript_16560/g.56442 Transcript_16560/m.56442 type:complete len:204 (-) Transcript_16560:2234-2845(-)